MPQGKLDFQLDFQPEPLDFQLDFQPDPVPQQQQGNFLTRSWAPPVNVPQNLPWYQKLPGEVYNRYIEPMTNPLGAALTGITGVAAGPGLRMIAGMFPKAIGYGTGAASAYGAAKAVPDAMSFAQNPSLGGALDLGEDASMAALFPMFGRKFIGSAPLRRDTGPLTSPFGETPNLPGIYQQTPIEQRMLGAFTPEGPAPTRAPLALPPHFVPEKPAPYVRGETLALPPHIQDEIPFQGTETYAGPRQLGSAPQRLGLPAVGETSIGRGQFMGGSAGMTDMSGIFPHNMGGKSIDIWPDIGPELAATRTDVFGRPFTNPGGSLAPRMNPDIISPGGKPSEGNMGFGPSRLQHPAGGLVVDAPQSTRPYDPTRFDVINRQIAPEPSPNPVRLDYSANRFDVVNRQLSPEPEMPIETPYDPNRFDVVNRQLGPEPRVKTATFINPQTTTATGIRPSNISMRDAAEANSRFAAAKVVTPANAKAVAAEATNSQFPAVKQGLWSQIVNDSRNLKTIWDFSAPLRQGAFLINKWEVGQFRDMFESAGSQKAYDAVMTSIKDGPDFDFKKDIMGIGYTGPLGKAEEAINHGWIEKHIPGALQSNRAYMAFTNKLRDDAADNVLGLAKNAGFDIKNNQPLARELGQFINAASGRGSLGKLEPIAGILNNAFFSPRLIASRLKMMNPNNFAQIGKEYGIMSKEANFMRKEYFKSLLSTAAMGNSFLGLSRLAGADIETDPASSDFMKAKFGNTRLDPWGGNQQYLTFAQRMFPGLGEYKSSTSGNKYNLSEAGFGQQTRGDIATGFMTNKLNTPYRALADYMLQTKGRPFSWSQQIENAVLPMMVQSLAEAIKENPTLGIATSPFGAMGGGVQTYGGQDMNQPLFLP